MFLPRRACRPLQLALVLLAWLLPAQPLAAAAEIPRLPAELGRVVYRQNPASPNQLFIVADSHRSSLTGANGPATVQAQLETFRIGAWLIDRRQVALLLPEGFFGNWQQLAVAVAPSPPDEAALRRELADTSHFVNAELLLHRRFGIALGQVEDHELYCRAGRQLRAGLEENALLNPGYATTLDYLQQRRLASMLQRAPQVIAAAFRQGQIATPRAMLTIGMAHLDDLLRILRGGEIRIPTPQPGDSAFPALEETLRLQQEGCGIAVIVPPALSADRPWLAAALPTTE